MSSGGSSTKPCVTKYSARVKSVIALNTETFEVELECCDQQCGGQQRKLNYLPGQYLQLELDLNGDSQPQRLFYSIANPVNSDHPYRLQLFIQNQNALTHRVLDHLQQLQLTNKPLNLNLPLGRAHLQTDLKLPHVLVAAGSGITQIKCLLEEAVKQNPDVVLHLYWSNRKVEDFFLLDEFKELADQHSYVKLVPILESDSDSWSGRVGFIYEAIQADFDNLANAQFYLCGSPKMVYGTIDQLKPMGLKERHCYSDVFEYAPRNQQLAS